MLTLQLQTLVNMKEETSSLYYVLYVWYMHSIQCIEVELATYCLTFLVQSPLAGMGCVEVITKCT